MLRLLSLLLDCRAAGQKNSNHGTLHDAESYQLWSEITHSSKHNDLFIVDDKNVDLNPDFTINCYEPGMAPIFLTLVEPDTDLRGQGILGQHKLSILSLDCIYLYPKHHTILFANQIKFAHKYFQTPEALDKGYDAEKIKKADEDCASVAKEIAGISQGECPSELDSFVILPNLYYKFGKDSGKTPENIVCVVAFLDTKTSDVHFSVIYPKLLGVEPRKYTFEAEDRRVLLDYSMQALYSKITSKSTDVKKALRQSYNDLMTGDARHSGQLFFPGDVNISHEKLAKKPKQRQSQNESLSVNVTVEKREEKDAVGMEDYLSKSRECNVAATSYNKNDLPLNCLSHKHNKPGKNDISAGSGKLYTTIDPKFPWNKYGIVLQIAVSLLITIGGCWAFSRYKTNNPKYYNAELF